MGGGKKGGKWKAESNQFREAMKAARDYAKAKKTGAPIPDMPVSEAQWRVAMRVGSRAVQTLTPTLHAPRPAPSAPRPAPVHPIASPHTVFS